MASVHAHTPAQLQGPRVLSRLTGPDWNPKMWPLQICFGDAPGRKKGEKLHDYALRVQNNVRELAKQEVRLPDQV